MTRGGAALWYRDFAARELDAFELMSPEHYHALFEKRLRWAGDLKQLRVGELERRLVALAQERLGRVTVIHPNFNECLPANPANTSFVRKLVERLAEVTVSGARALVATYGGFTYLGPLLRVPTLSFYEIEQTMSIHLEVKRGLGSPRAPPRPSPRGTGSGGRPPARCAAASRSWRARSAGPPRPSTTAQVGGRRWLPRSIGSFA
jgi:hypothetical protein